MAKNLITGYDITKSESGMPLGINGNYYHPEVFSTSLIEGYKADIKNCQDISSNYF